LTPGGEGSSPPLPPAVERRKRAVGAGARERGASLRGRRRPPRLPARPPGGRLPSGNADFGGLEITPSPLSAPSSGGGGQPPARRRNDCTACEVRRGRRWRKNGRCGKGAAAAACAPCGGRGRRRPRPIPASRRGWAGDGRGARFGAPARARRGLGSKPLLTAETPLFLAIPPAGITAGGIARKSAQA
jgi:hypothetical protein